MYVPFHNREPDREKIIAFMSEYPFATLITTRENKLTATHLPVLIEERGEELFLVAHLARANTQWTDFAGSASLNGDKETPDALMIFQEPHAFISTRHYERPLSVPTWNYVAVHAYGVPHILESIEDRLRVVQRTVMQFEGSLEQWDSLPDEFRRTKANGIVAFEMYITRVDARFKLSQDRTPTERENIVESLSARAENVEFEIAAMMREKMETTNAPG
jgi:transcriptional regulator